MIGWNPDRPAGGSWPASAGCSWSRRRYRRSRLPAGCRSCCSSPRRSLHPLFTGAMCAAGTLDASRFGYPTLLVKVAVFLLTGLWLVVHRATAGAVATGLVRFRHLAVLVIVAALVAENLLQRFFADLDPEIITSCCATIFGAEGSGVGSGSPPCP